MIESEARFAGLRDRAARRGAAISPMRLCCCAAAAELVLLVICDASRRIDGDRVHAVLRQTQLLCASAAILLAHSGECGGASEGVLRRMNGRDNAGVVYRVDDGQLTILRPVSSHRN